MDALLLARIQFAANISFHILFPAITIALAWVLVFFNWRSQRDDGEAWNEAYRFWVKVFALSFALGVVSGLTMSFQFGTNWPGFMNRVGNIAGPLLAYEVLSAFFLEATFLGIMLFGRQRVSPRVHTLATVMVALGTTISAFWIIALNAWMQTPTGHGMVEGELQAISWWRVVFNPSMHWRLLHMLVASGLTVAFLIAGLAAFRWLRGQRNTAVMLELRTGVWLAAVLIPAQWLLGDLHGLNTLKHQPAKVAAMEALWETGPQAPAVLFAWPDERLQENRWELGIPGLASLYLTHDSDGVVQGLKDFPDHPPVVPVFFAFRVMVGIALLMWVISWIGAWQLRRGGLGRGTARALVAMTFSGWVAVLAGWYVAEIGRQPWLVYGELRTAEAAADLPAPMIGLSLAGYLALYALLTISYIGVLFYLAAQAGERKES